LVHFFRERSRWPLPAYGGGISPRDDKPLLPPQATYLRREHPRFAHPRYGYWEINKSWVELTAPFASRIRGHQQVTDAYLLGLAIKEKGVLVTFDKGLQYLAGAEFRQNVLLLE